MGLSYYDEIELEDMEFDDEKQVFHYPCPCGDRFEISLEQLRSEEDVARCPSCTLIIRVIYDPVRAPRHATHTAGPRPVSYTHLTLPTILLV